MKKNLNLLILITSITVMFFSTKIIGQVTVYLNQPPPNQWHIEYLWSIDLVNPGPVDIAAKLKGTIYTGSGEIIFDAESYVINIRPGFQKVVYDDLVPASILYSNPDYMNVVEQTGSLPGGTYEICITVEDFVLGEDIGINCYQQNVAHPSPPELLTPFEGDSLLNHFPVFSWIPPMPVNAASDINYELTITEIYGEQSPEEAITTNLPWLQVDRINSTVFTYPMDASEFETGKSYCWQVRSTTYDGYPYGQNDGRSEVSVFIIEDLFEPNPSCVQLTGVEPQTVEAGSDTTVTIYGKGFSEDILFDINSDDIEINSIEFISDDEIMLDIHVSTVAQAGSYTFNVPNGNGNENGPVPAIDINVNEAKCEELKEKHQALCKVIDERKAACKALKVKGIQLLYQKMVKHFVINGINWRLNTALQDRKDALKGMKRLVKGIGGPTYAHTEPPAGDPRAKNHVGFCDGKVKIWFAGDKHTVQTMIKWLNNSWEARNKIENSFHNAGERLAKAREDLKNANAELDKINDELKQVLEDLSECLDELEELEKQRDDLEEAHQKCLERLIAQRKCRERMESAEDKVTAAESIVKSTQEEIDKLKEQMGEGSAEADLLLRRAEEKLEETKEKAEEMRNSLDSSKKAYEDGDLDEANRQSGKVNEEELESIKGASEQAIQLTQKAVRAYNSWYLEQQRIAEAKRLEELIKNAIEEKENNKNKNEDDQSLEAFNKLMQELGLQALSEASPATGAILQGLITMANMPENARKILIALKDAMNHNNNEESIQFHVIQFLNAWKDCAGLPNLPTTIFPGAGELTKIIKELPDSVKIQIYSSLQGIIDQKK